ncbi:SDR family NAD(P)-dependent oxidoreductase, partial [Paenibacillus sp. Y412MC10]|uniref:SDR family NAD(P)-dependent oxidoreductase n=1 Tax=Geobacillus sp. (strain Y412MC10) TaxID=481743 RepID=UPI0037C73921
MPSFPTLHLLLNNHPLHYLQRNILHITQQHLHHTYHTNIFPFFFIIHPSLPHMKTKPSIINTPSITPYHPLNHLIHYSSTKGPILSLTPSL